MWSSVFLREGDGFDYVEALRGCVEKLSERQRQALSLRYWKKVPREEMGARLGIGGEGVKGLLRRIRAALKECVGRSLGGSAAAPAPTRRGREGVMVISGGEAAR